MKTWVKTNLSKITLALSMVGAVTGTVGLIVGIVGVHESTKFDYFEKPNHEIVLGNTIIWWNKWNSPDMTDLYFSSQKHHTEDIKWDRTYTPGYFK